MRRNERRGTAVAQIGRARYGFWLLLLSLLLALSSFLFGADDTLSLLAPLVWFLLPILLFLLFLANQAQWLLPTGRRNWYEAWLILLYRYCVLDLPKSLVRLLSPSSLIRPPKTAPASFGELRAGIVPSHQVLAIAQPTPRVAGPGFVRLGRFEAIDQVIDLRLHHRKQPVEAVTRDGIPVQTSVSSLFRVHPPAQDGAIQRGRPLALGDLEMSPLTPGQLPYSIAPDATLRASNLVYVDGDKLLHWHQALTPFLAGRLVAAIASHSFDEVGDDRARRAPPLDLPALKEQLRVQAWRHFYRDGLFIQNVGVGFLQLPSEVNDQLFHNWEHDWEERMKQHQTGAEAEALRRARRRQEEITFELLRRLINSVDENGVPPGQLAQRLLEQLLAELAEMAVEGYVPVLLPFRVQLSLNRLQNWLQEP